MSCILLGNHNASFTAGIAEYAPTGDILPFFGVGPTALIEAALENKMPMGTVVSDLDSVKQAISVFSEHGTVVFMDNLEASTNMLNTIVRVLRIASESDWVFRDQQTMTIN